MAAKVARERATDNLVNNLLPKVEFVKVPSSSIICFLCKEVLKNPMQLSCGHRVCKGCIETSIPTKNGERACPEDGEIIERAFPDRSALTDIMNSACFCVVNLDGCTWLGLLLDLEEHLKDCEFFVQLKCPFHDFQCQFTGTKGNLEKHLAVDSVRHDSLLATCVRELINTAEENHANLNITKEKTIEIEKSFAESKEAVVTLQRTLNETTDKMNNKVLYIKRLKDQYSVFEELITRSKNEKSKVVDFQNKFQELVRNIESQMNAVNETETASSSKGTGGNSKNTLVEKVKRLEESKTTHGKQIADLGIKIRIFQCSSNDGDYVWKLDNLENRFQEAKSGKVTELYTPPLYTSSFGYKYSAKIMLGGEKNKDANSADHIAFYIVLMQGDFDEILKFPFPYPVVITLVNPGNNSKNITRTLYPDPKKGHFEKPFKNMNPAIGFSRLISHEQLFGGGFVDKNSLYFKIKVDKTGIQVNEPDI